MSEWKRCFEFFGAGLIIGMALAHLAINGIRWERRNDSTNQGEIT